MGISIVCSFPVWSGGSLIIFLALQVGMLSCMRGRHGELSACNTEVVHMPSYICMPPYVCMPQYPLYICMFPHTICSPYVMGTWGASVHPICLGVFWGSSVHLSGISVSVSISIASQFITVIAVAPQYCGMLLYWTGCLLCFMVLFLSL